MKQVKKNAEYGVFGFSSVPITFIAIAIVALSWGMFKIVADGPVSATTNSVLFILVIAGAVSLILLWLSRSLGKASAGDSSSLKTVASCVDSAEATAIINRLADHRIQAKAVGGFTSGFQAEAPGEVQIVVRQMDFERANAIVNDLLEPNG